MSTQPSWNQALPPEVLARSAAARLVRTPRRLRQTSQALATVVVVLLVVVAVVPWVQTVQGRGRVVAFAPVERQQEVDAPIEGRVMKWFVREGSRVKKGDPLFEISDNDPSIIQRLREEREAVTSRRDANQLRVQSILNRQASLARARDAALRAAESRVKMAKQRTLATRQAKEAAEEAERIAKLNVDRQRSLKAQGLSADRTVELAEFEAVRAQTQVQREVAALQAAIGEELALEADRLRVLGDFSASIDDARASEAAAQAEEANAQAELARIEVRLARQSTMAVTALLDGTVLRLGGGQGNEFVKAGDPMLTLIPDTEERAVELWVDGNDMPLLSEGRDVRLQFEGWPAVQFTGWPSVAVGTFAGTLALIDATDDGAGKFRVLVKPRAGAEWPSGLYLRQGVRVNGWVLLNQVTLGYELWRQFNGFPPTVAKSEPKQDGGDKDDKPKGSPKSGSQK